MQITLKLYATLGKFLPAEAKRNQATIEVPEGTSVLKILTDHNVPMETCHLILVNGHYTAPADSGSKRVVDGDTVAVWPPIAGG